MSLNPRFVTICRMAGLAEWTNGPFKPTRVLQKISGATQAESDFLMQVICMCRDELVAWGLIEGAFVQLIKDRPKLGAYFTIAKEAAANAAQDRLKRDRS